MRYNPFFDARPREAPENEDEIEYNEVDQYGRRFRKVGNCIEYEPEINGVPRSVFFRSQKAQKIADEERREPPHHLTPEAHRLALGNTQQRQNVV